MIGRGDVLESVPDPLPDCRPARPVIAHPLISLTGIWRHWGRGRNRWPVLRDVSLDVAAGTAVCISGGNGAGKTTLLRIATGLLAPDSGAVTICGISERDNWREFHRSIGFLSAGDRGLYPRVAVRNHLDYWASLAFLPRAARAAAVEESLVRFDLEELAGRRADRLSQGQRQRLRLALAFLHRPHVLLLDEPRNSLDAAGAERLRAAVQERLATGAAVIACCPSGEDQPIPFDRFCVLEDGKLRPA